MKPSLNSTQKSSNHVFLLEQQEKLPGWQKPQAHSVVWSYDMEGHAQKCVERYCELANKKVEQLYKVSRLVIGRWSVQKGGTGISWRIVRSLLKCLHLARIGRPDILWSVNKLARSVTKWTQACDKRLARLISYIHHTNDYRQYCHGGNTAQHCRLGLFQDSDFAGDFEDSKVNLRRCLVYFWKEHLFQSVGCARNKHQVLIPPQSLKLFLWMLDYVWMGFLLLTHGTLWSRTTFNLVTQEQGKLGRSNQTILAQGNLRVLNSTICDSKSKTQHVNWEQGVDQLSEVDRVPTNTRSSQGGISVVHLWRQRSRDQDDN